MEKSNIRGGSPSRKPDGLAGLAHKIAARLESKPEIFVNHPAELRILRAMSDVELRGFAAEHGWRVVRRLGSRQIEFYNDASARHVARSQGNQP